MIYLDNAATSWPKPEIVYKTMESFLRTVGGNPGRASHSMAIAAGSAVEEARILVAQLIDASDKNRVIFTLNCTDALNLGLKGLLKAGDHVITDSIGHNSVVRPLTKLEQQEVKVTRLASDKQTGSLSADDIEKAITKETKLIVVTHASNVTGVIQPIKEYGEIAKKHNVIFMVDAAQTAGTYPINIKDSHIDLLAFSGHKGLLGPPGTGVLYVGKRAVLDSIREGGTGSQSELEKQPTQLPQMYESGTPNTVGIAGLGAALRFILDLGVKNIRDHEIELIGHLLNGLLSIPQITVYGPNDAEKQVAVVSFNIEGWEPAEAGAILDQSFDIKVRTGLYCAPVAHKTFGTFPTGSVRIGLGYFNTIEDIDFTVEALKKMANSKGGVA
ncbi:MAG: aminotransferase class V-fold PLP-dependent enzyme [Chloroflexi bacterium]|jgi:cysteine desulfurase / selenocysteine lyase|nr:aminotransferase class V-fold PLP-dependent enzyme [Chloroflexota bacterium]MBT7081532.1 aminotransferase class V-fold PLP-dependent enzyme [Chloroflexota bacterium]MBT7289353.1 aminotransferase class V-fold PLP-dependent enzyme [Chloroflexota bacterium]